MSNTVFCSIHSLNISIPVIFNSEEIKDLIIPVVSERISVIRLPHYEWESSPSYPCSHDISITAEADKEELLVEFSCQAFKGSYKVIIDGFHWDFWKALISSFSHALGHHSSILLQNQSPTLLQRPAFETNATSFRARCERPRA